MNLYDTLPNPVVFAHRGASAYAPENTLAAFRMAVEHGADGIELDAKLTADGQVVVIHDQTVERTTGAQGTVRDMKLADLKALDAGSFFSPAFAGEPVPTLEEVFEAVGQDLLINVEITNYASAMDALPDRIADLVLQYKLQDRVVFSSFHPLNLIRIRKRLPETPTAILTDVGFRSKVLRALARQKFAPPFVHPYFTDVSAQSMSADHRANRRVNVWTVNQPDEMLRLFKIGIDGIITDDPRLAKRVLKERR